MMPPIAGYRAVAVADKWACGPLAGAVLVSPGQAMILGQLSSLQQLLAAELAGLGLTGSEINAFG